MDDGSLSISTNINHNNKKIYITPHIYLYLQNYPLVELTLLKNHIINFFQINLRLARRSSSDRNKNYTAEENKLLVTLKKSGHTDKEIAIILGRSYWSVVYKLSELRRINLL
jgi:hypothetical protein